MELILHDVYKRKFACTLNIVVNWLKDYKIVHTPTNMKRNVSWVTVPGEKSITIEPDPSRLIYLMRSEDIVASGFSGNDVVGLLVLGADEPMSPYSTSTLDRLLIVKETKESPSFATLQSNLQTHFLFIERFTSRCEEIVRGGGTLQELVDTIEPLFGNWVNVTSPTYSLLAYTQNVQPPEGLCADLVKTGCHSKSRIEAAQANGALKEWGKQDDVEVFEPDSLVPYHYATTVLQFNGTYQGHVVMVMNNHEISDGVIDFFKMFCSFCSRLIDRQLQGIRAGSAPYQDFIEQLIDGKSLSSLYINTQKNVIGLSGINFYRMSAINYSDGPYAGQLVYLLSVIKDTFPQTLSIPYHGYIVVVYCTEDYDCEYDIKMLDILNDFCEHHGCIAYNASYSKRIENLSLLYKQTEIARRYRSCLEVDLRSSGVTLRKNIYMFDDVMAYYFNDFTVKDEQLVSHCMNTTLLDLIMEKDKERSVSDLKLLHCFLCNERRATPTAEILHMHRNNVLYRIRCIEERYAIDLGRFDIRQLLLSCYRLKIMNSDSFREKIV